MLNRWMSNWLQLKALHVFLSRCAQSSTLHSSEYCADLETYINIDEYHFISRRHCYNFALFSVMSWQFVLHSRVWSLSPKLCLGSSRGWNLPRRCDLQRTNCMAIRRLAFYLSGEEGRYTHPRFRGRICNSDSKRQTRIVLVTSTQRCVWLTPRRHDIRDVLGLASSQIVYRAIRVYEQTLVAQRIPPDAIDT